MTLMRGNSRLPSGLCEMPRFTTVCGAAPVMSSPWKRIAPCRGLLMPLIARSVVDFPAPFAPMRVTISPARTLSETPFSAWIAP